MSFSSAVLWAVPATGSSTPSQQRSRWPIREQRQSLPLFIFISPHFGYSKAKSASRSLMASLSIMFAPTCMCTWFFSCLMQFFSGTAANSIYSGFAVLCVDNSAFARSWSDADAVRTSTSFSKHHCWTHNHSKECPLWQRSPQGSGVEIFHSDQPVPENPLQQLFQIHFHPFRWLFEWLVISALAAVFNNHITRLRLGSLWYWGNFSRHDFPIEEELIIQRMGI